MKKVQREDWADFAKGIGIILVRFGHQKIFGKKIDLFDLCISYALIFYDIWIFL